MVEKDVIVKEEFRYNGIAIWKDVYEHAHTWLKGEDYVIHEEKYEEIHRGDTKEARIKWVATKKITDYFRSYIEVNWQLLNMTDVEVEINGKKKKMNKFSELKLNIKGVLERDYEGKWEPSRFYKFLKEMYQKYIIPERIDQMEDKVRDLVQDFKEEMKGYLQLTARR